MPKILMPIPSRDFDPSETAVPWHVFKEAGFEVIFATPNGKIGICDEIMLDGKGLDIWGNIPILRNLVVFGQILRANRDAREKYAKMSESPEFQKPINWSKVGETEFDGVFLAGGHRARGMCQYLESDILQNFLRDFIKTQKPIGAICHGPLLLARTKDEATKQSIIFGRKITALTWALEKSANDLGNILRWWDRNYYRTYNEIKGEKYGERSVESEIKSLIGAENFCLPDKGFKINSGLFRDSDIDESASFVVQDKNIVTARWPGDVYALAKKFVALFANS